MVHGLPALKTHAKCLLIVRREGDGVRHYVHVGTGNYNPKTARLYTDFGLLTCDEQIGADVADMFNFLTGFARPRRYRQVLVAPAHLRDAILGEIEATIAARQEGRRGRIRMKMNSLVDRRCIQALYRASQAGVRGRAQRARHLLPAPGRARGVGEHPRALGRRALPRALAHLRVRARRRLHGLHRLGGPDAAQPRHARGAAGAGARPGAAAPTSPTRWTAAWPTTPTAGRCARTATGAHDRRQHCPGHSCDRSRRPLAVLQPRAVVAAVQLARARARRGSGHAAARAREVLRDLLLEPRRVLHGPRRGAARPDRRRDRDAAAGRAHAERDDRADPLDACASTSRARRRCWTATCARRWPSTASGSSASTRSPRRSARRSTSASGARSSRCSRRWRSASGGRSPTSPTSRCRSASSSATRSAGVEAFARVKVPKEMLPRFVAGRRRAHLRPARGPDRQEPHDALPRDGDRRPRRLPGHARRGLHGLRRGRRPRAGGRGRAAPPPLRRGRPRRGRRRR